MFCIYDSSWWYYFALGLPTPKNGCYMWLIISYSALDFLWIVSKEDKTNYKALKK